MLKLNKGYCLKFLTEENQNTSLYAANIKEDKQHENYRSQ